MYNQLLLLVVGGLVSITTAAATAYLTTLVKFRIEQRKQLEDWRANILEKYYQDPDDFRTLAQQFAIGVIFYEDPSQDEHHDKVFIPKNFNLTVGRADNCDIRLTGSTVSRIHALLSSNNEDVFIEDLLSTNSTLVNHEPIMQKTLLSHDAQILIGNSLLKYKKLGQ